MKVRITLMTENDKHASDDISDADLQAQIELGWNMFINLFCKDKGEKANVEKIEVLER